MNLATFKSSPWSSSHEAYKKSALALNPAPEYASAEVLLASLYRTIGLASVQEKNVAKAGKDLDQKLQKQRAKGQRPQEGATVDAEVWSAVLHGVLESPKLPMQSSKRFLQATPLTPSISTFSGAVRLAGNPWVPGNLVRRMVWLGSADAASAQAVWRELFAAMAIDDDDDVFARWLEQESSAWSGKQEWALVEIPEDEMSSFSGADYQGVGFLPARQFVKDLHAIIDAKHAVTRRQWISLLEAVLRLAAVMHVTWLCDVQARIWRCLSDSAGGGGPIGTDEVRAAIFPTDPQYMTYGGKALNGLKDRASSYLSARLGTNAILWGLSEVGAPYGGGMSSSEDVAMLCEHVRKHGRELQDAGVLSIAADIREQEARALNCKKGIGSNILEFARHGLGQRQTTVQLLRGYDQGYLLKKQSSSQSSPWVVSMGPVAVLALVHCALAGMGGARSVHRLGQHLAAYGLIVDRQDVSQNDLGHQLRMLGLVLDSPDAESGMLVMPPFRTPSSMGVEV